MCLLIVEISMFIAGFWALITGKLPESLFKLLFGKGEYHAEPKEARLFGLLLASPIPLSFLGGLLMGGLFGADGAQYAVLLETFILIVVCIIAVIIARSIKTNQSMR